MKELVNLLVMKAELQRVVDRWNGMYFGDKIDYSDAMRRMDLRIESIKKHLRDGTLKN